MIPSFAVLALAGLAAATIEPRRIMHEVRDRESYIHHRDVTGGDSEPCAILSEVYEASGAVPGESKIVAVPPSIGIACLKSVPYNKQRDLALLDYLLPFINFQSTLEVLANPPDEYLLPGVDVLGGIEVIRSKLEKDEYENQYEVMKDLRSLFAAANDNHFDYPPALLNTFLYVRRGLDFTAISKNGIKIPQIFMTLDVIRGNQGQLTYLPSGVDSIDGTPIFEWLEKDAVHNTINYQDPDAQWNALFSTIPSGAAGKSATTLITGFEIPDNYTVRFQNGSSVVYQNEIVFLPKTDFSCVENGEDFYETFERPKTTVSSEPTPTPTPTVNPAETETEAPEQATNSALPPIHGYPSPVVKHAQNSIAGYFLNETDYKDTAVLTILSFLPIGFDFANIGEFNFTEYVLEGTRVIVEFAEKAKKEGRDKLIIDLSANGGGSVNLAQQVYRLLFPDGKFSTFDRYRANEALEATSEADYMSLVNTIITQSNDFPVDTDGKPIKTGKEWFGPYTAGGQNVTKAFQDDRSLPFDASIGAYYNGYDPKKPAAIEKAPWKPENILVVTDGTCASACNILTGLLTHNHGIRTLALGGRPNYYPMQAMGGVKGSLLNFNGDLITAVTSFIDSVKGDEKAIEILKDAKDAFPTLEDAPLLPLIHGSSGGQVNSRNAYHEDDLDGFPAHFKYEAANCKLFYTQQMTFDVSESWRQAANVAWNGGSCVVGSTVNDDGTIGDEALKYDSRVRSRVPGIKNPGALV
ncbi:Fc.00g075340.m01.CDS01 [Cosmosporella sp. VM-42]